MVTNNGYFDDEIRRFDDPETGLLPPGLAQSMPGTNIPDPTSPVVSNQAVPMPMMGFDPAAPLQRGVGVKAPYAVPPTDWLPPQIEQGFETGGPGMAFVPGSVMDTPMRGGGVSFGPGLDPVAQIVSALKNLFSRNKATTPGTGSGNQGSQFQLMQAPGTVSYPLAQPNILEQQPLLDQPFLDQPFETGGPGMALAPGIGMDTPLGTPTPDVSYPLAYPNLLPSQQFTDQPFETGGSSASLAPGSAMDTPLGTPTQPGPGLVQSLKNMASGALKPPFDPRSLFSEQDGPALLQAAAIDPAMAQAPLGAQESLSQVDLSNIGMVPVFGMGATGQQEFLGYGPEEQGTAGRVGQAPTVLYDTSGTPLAGTGFDRQAGSPAAMDTGAPPTGTELLPSTLAPQTSYPPGAIPSVTGAGAAVAAPAIPEGSNLDQTSFQGAWETLMSTGQLPTGAMKLYTDPETGFSELDPGSEALIKGYFGLQENKFREEATNMAKKSADREELEATRQYGMDVGRFEEEKRRTGVQEQLGADRFAEEKRLAGVEEELARGSLFGEVPIEGGEGGVQITEARRAEMARLDEQIRSSKAQEDLQKAGLTGLTEDNKETLAAQRLKQENDIAQKRLEMDQEQLDLQSARLYGEGAEGQKTLDAEGQRIQRILQGIEKPREGEREALAVRQLELKLGLETGAEEFAEGISARGIALDEERLKEAVTAREAQTRIALGEMLGYDPEDPRVRTIAASRMINELSMAQKGLDETSRANMIDEAIRMGQLGEAERSAKVDEDIRRALAGLGEDAERALPVRQLTQQADLADKQRQLERDLASLQAATSLSQSALANPYAFGALRAMSGGGGGPVEQLLQSLSPMGFNIPTQGFGQVSDLFGGQVPTLGGLQQAGPDALQTLTSMLGFGGISPGSLAQQAGAVTPGQAFAAPTQFTRGLARLR